MSDERYENQIEARELSADIMSAIELRGDYHNLSDTTIFHHIEEIVRHLSHIVIDRSGSVDSYANAIMRHAEDIEKNSLKGGHFTEPE